MEKTTLVAIHDFGRARLLGTLDAIEKSGADVAAVLAWRPGPGRAHIAWQAMHCAATHDRYLNKLILQKNPADEAFCQAYGGGSTPSDEHIPSLDAIREKLSTNYVPLKAYIQNASPENFATVQKMPNGIDRSIGESLLLLAWHEAHHQGQIHLTWNLYKTAHGIN